jgi:hypothetical protein
MTRAIGVEIDCPFTPAMLRKVIYAGAQSCSFVQATKDLEALAEAKVSRERVQRWTKRVGEERLQDAQAAAASYQALPLPQRRTSPTGQVPQVACVMTDGGRMQVRKRCDPRRDVGSYWKESLVGCCLSMISGEHDRDPCPTIPKTFVDPARMNDLSREIKGFSAAAEAVEQAIEDAPDQRQGRPEALVKSVVATCQGRQALGQRLAAEAHARGFHAAVRKAFVADGAATNWSIHQQYFSHYTPILDFTHAICYVYAAAMAGRAQEAAWRDYRQWAQWLWEGSIAPLIEAVEARSQHLGPPPEGDETSPAAVVARALGYLKNQRLRMNYAEYRRLGLPMTSSHIESTIKQLNRRMKGTEKFWDQGAEPLLQLAADHLSDTPTLSRFWRQRQRQLPTTRCYQNAA